jgi:hypothetical protein
VQVGAGIYAQHTASATRELFWGLSQQLLSPCSLFDEGDAHCIKQLVLELAFCRQQQLGVLQQAFFNSSDVSGVDFMMLRLFVTMVVDDVAAADVGCGFTVQ